jgi:hypothetical protein
MNITPAAASVSEESDETDKKKEETEKKKEDVKKSAQQLKKEKTTPNSGNVLGKKKKK